MATQELTDLIDGLIREKTFSLEAVDAIKALRDKAKGLEDRLAVALADVETKKKQYEAVDAERAAWRAREATVASREGSVVEREKKITDLEKSSAVALAVSTTWADAFHTIFKNTTVRRNVNSSVPVSVPAGGGYASNQSGFENETVEQD